MPKPIAEMTAQELHSERRTLDELLAWGAAQPDDDFDRYNDELVEAAITAPRGEFVLELDIEDDDTPAEGRSEEKKEKVQGIKLIPVAEADALVRDFVESVSYVEDGSDDDDIPVDWNREDD